MSSNDHPPRSSGVVKLLILSSVCFGVGFLLYMVWSHWGTFRRGGHARFIPVGGFFGGRSTPAGHAPGPHGLVGGGASGTSGTSRGGFGATGIGGGSSGGGHSMGGIGG